jgi:hypothetical protein
MGAFKVAHLVKSWADSTVVELTCIKRKDAILFHYKASVLDRAGP